MGKQEAKAKYTNFIPPHKKVENWYKNFNFVLIDSMEKLEGVFKDVKPKSYYMGFDTETTGLDFEELDLVGYSFCLDGKNTYYVPVYHFDYEHNLGEASVDFIYQKMVEAKKVFMFNARYDMRVMEYIGYKDKKEELDKKRWKFVKYDMSKVDYFDVACAVWNSDTNIKMPSLKYASEHFLGFSQMHFDEVVENAGNFFYLNPSTNPDVAYYAGADALCTYLLVTATAKYFMEAKMAGKLDNAVLYPLMHFENEKLWLDKDKLDRMEIDARKEVDRLEKEVYDMLGYQINLNSPRQVAQALSRLGIDTGERTASGTMATGMSVLNNLPEEVLNEYPALKSFVEYKKMYKLLSSYISVYQKEANSRGFLRGSYKNTDAPTGRLACGKDGKNHFFSPVNLQAIPKPHVSMYDVFDLGDRKLFRKKDNILFGYQFKMSQYDKDGNHIVPEDSSYMGMAEGMNPKFNLRDTILPKMYEDSGEDEFCYCTCDYAAQELRITANISREPVWTDAFLHGRDVHKSTAIALWGEEHYNKDYRKRAKACMSVNSIFYTKGGAIRGYNLKGIKYTTEYGDTYNIDNLGLLDIHNTPQKASYFVEDRDGYGVELENGVILEVTKGHKFLVSDKFDKEFESVDDLQVGRSLLLSPMTSFGGYHTIQIDSDSKNKSMLNLKLDEYFSYTMGLYLGDGTISKGLGTLSIVVKDYNLGYVTKFLNKIGNPKIIEKTDKYTIVNLYSTRFIRVLNNLCGRVKDKHVPDMIFTSPRSVMMSFIAGLLDSDGKIGENSIEYQSTNERLIRGVSELLVSLGFGIISFKKQVGVLKSKYRKEDEDYKVDYYSLRVSYDRELFSSVPIKNPKSIGYLKNRKVDSDSFNILENEVGKFKVLDFYKGNHKVLENFISRKSKTLSKNLVEKIGDWRKGYSSSKIVRITPKTVKAVCLECSTHVFKSMTVSRNCNFGIIYGMGPSSMVGKKFGIHSLPEAEEFYAKYKGKLSTLFQWIDRTQRRARKMGTTYTFFGRPRRLKSYYQNGNVGFANRTAVNTQIQGTAGDMLKLVMCRLWKNLYNNPEYENDISFMVTIHDEIGNRIRTSRANELVGLIEDNQTVKIKEWPIPIITEASLGWSIGSVFAFERVWHTDENGNRTGEWHYEPKLD